MAQRSKKNLYFLVLGICGAALIADRLFLSEPITGPAQSEAKGTRVPAGPGGAAASPGVPASDDSDRVLSIPELPFPRELPPIPDQTQLRDLFSRRRSTVRQVEGAELENGAGEHVDIEPQDRVKTFSQRHSLQGLFSDSGLKIAVVDGTWVRIGDKIDGCTLVTVDGNQAGFQCGDRETVLNIQPASVSGSH